MQVGKIGIKDLKDKVLNNITHHRQDVLLPAEVGEDSSVINFGKEVLVISSDPITGASEDIGYLAVNIACNDIAATGAQPVGIQVVILFPEEYSETKFKKLMREIDETAVELGAEVLGGHTEVLSSINYPIIVVTAVGRCKKDNFIKTGGAKAGDDIIVTKGLGIEGTFILANEYKEKLIKKGISQDILSKALSYKNKLSVLREGLIAAKNDVHAMHDITEGGLYGALDEMSRAAEVGFEINNIDKAISETTKLICESFSLNPAALISSGSMLITASPEQKIIEILKEEGIKAYKIGCIKEKGRYQKKAGKKVKFSWSGEDELWRFME
ncbi:MAG: AIR synthase family protein [Halanaerobiales bacterium]